MCDKLTWTMTTQSLEPVEFPKDCMKAVVYLTTLPFHNTTNILEKTSQKGNFSKNLKHLKNMWKD